ncbi:MAG: glycosyl hydrolase family 28 protein [Myxococcota bacterium]|nr:glycosyl hydrolase family 28 protein [Myxococcota bacterium]
MGPLPWAAANAILCRIVPPTFPAKTCTVTDAAYGAKADGATDDTDAFKKAIADCSQAGGGHVVVPSGSYVSGAIELLDNVDLQFQMGAVIKFSADVSKYPVVLTRYEGIELMNHSPMIYAYKRTNIAVTGPGVLDASATGSWNTGSSRAPLEAYANSNTPVTMRSAGGCCRSTFVEPYSCTNVLIQGITLRGAHFWQIHPTLSTNVTVDGVHVTDSGLPNDDGFDPESSDHVLLTNSTIESSDDAMAVKSGRDADGRRINVPTSNFVFMHSSFASKVGLLTLGSEATGGIHDVYGYDIKTTSAGVTYVLQIKGNTQRGGVVTDVHLDTVVSTGVRSKVVNADMHYMGQTGPYMPMYGNFSLSNATVSGAPQVLNLVGLSAAAPLGPVVMSNSTYTNIGNATNIAQNATVSWNNVTINGAAAH